MDSNKELRLMHACERGAVGVYRGHKCVARYFFRSNLNQIDSMRDHESDHATIFENLLVNRNGRLCYGHQLFFWGGLFYGVLVGFIGLRAIGISTYTIENIVDHEFDIALEKLKGDSELYNQIKIVQLEEREHRKTGEELAGSRLMLAGFIQRLAKAGAYTAKYMASIL
jgi:ubiquinone biosynthesis monooxygenase Coq7